MAKSINKETLFNDYFYTATKSLSDFEAVMNVEGVCSQYFGVQYSEETGFKSASNEEQAKSFVRESDAWKTLSELYDYAVNGLIAQGAHPEEAVIGGADVLSMVTYENSSPSEEWENIKTKGDGRFALDSGEDISINKLTLLAGVSIRTVRNAISAGEITADKGAGNVFVNNASARKWLSSRRSFKATAIISSDVRALSDIETPLEFSAYIKLCRKNAGFDTDNKKLAIFIPSIDAKAITELEEGLFTLPLDAVFPLADLYQIDRNEFLGTVMRVFFNEQLSVITHQCKNQALVASS